MSERDSIGAVSAPNTVDSLTADFVRLGLRPGTAVLVHSSLASLGWVCGRATAVIQALQRAITSRGTLLMPTHSGDLSDPKYWAHPPVPQPWWSEIRRTMPVFDAALTPTRGMGVVPETFRHQRGVVRSRHPQVSFAAWGRYRRELTDDHSWDWPLGNDSPLGRLRDLKGKVLLLGVGHESNTSLHLAESLAHWPSRVEINEPAPWRRRKGTTLWKPVINVGYQGDDFPEIGAAFERAHPEVVSLGQVGRAPSRLLDQAALVDFAVTWMESRR